MWLDNCVSTDLSSALRGYNTYPKIDGVEWSLHPVECPSTLVEKHTRVLGCLCGSSVVDV